MEGYSPSLTSVVIVQGGLVRFRLRPCGLFPTAANRCRWKEESAQKVIVKVDVIQQINAETGKVGKLGSVLNVIDGDQDSGSGSEFESESESINSFSNCSGKGGAKGKESQYQMKAPGRTRRLFLLLAPSSRTWDQKRRESIGR